MSNAIRQCTQLGAGVPLLTLALACATSQPSEPVAPANQAHPIAFSFGTTEGKIFDSDSTRGRSTAVLFVTTFDLASQAQARTLNEVLRRHTPRANAVAVVLEAPKYRVFAESFRTGLGLSYPVALANPATFDAHGPFGDIPGVPTLVVLDRHGRPVFRSTGAVAKEKMEEALAAADAERVLPNP